MILMGGPIDTRRSPTAVNLLAEERGIDWFERHCIMKVPPAHPGFWRNVYPGFLQLSGFMAMNLDRHVTAHWDMFNHLVDGDGDSAEKHRDFYDEYLAVMDLTAEFYLQTVDKVFVRHELPKGEMMHRDKPVDLVAIRRCAIMAIEGERDDISGVGQTLAALDLTPNLSSDKKLYHLQKGVGHYGVFNGSRFRSEIAPRIAEFVRQHAVADQAAEKLGKDPAKRPSGNSPRRQPPKPVPDRFWPAANGCADNDDPAGHIADMKFALFRRVPEDPQHLKVSHEGRTLKVALKRRPTAKRITLRVSNASGEVVLTIPERTSVDIAQRFADGHGAWIANRLAKVPTRVIFEPGALVPLRGVPHRIVHWSNIRGVTQATTGSDGTPILAVSGDIHHVARRVQDYPRGRGAPRFLRQREAPHHGFGHPGQAHHRARHQEPMGLLLVQRSLELLLAAHHGAAFRARLSRGPRGRSLARAEPFPPLLETDPPALSAHRRRGEMAQDLRQRPAPVRVSERPRLPLSLVSR